MGALKESQERDHWLARGLCGWVTVAGLACGVPDVEAPPPVTEIDPVRMPELPALDPAPPVARPRIVLDNLEPMEPPRISLEVPTSPVARASTRAPAADPEPALPKPPAPR